MKQRPSNFDIERELAEQSATDWVFGALSQPGVVSIPPGERDAYLPIGETQFDSLTDFTDCASRSPVNHLEALFTYHYQHAMKADNKLWLKDNGYVSDNRVTFSDRYIAILSGTTRNGNSLKSPLDAIHNQGLVPKKLLPKEDWMAWDDYYDTSKITQTLKDLGQEFKSRFTINYEQVYKTHFADVLKDDMVGVAGYAWPAPVEGVYPAAPGMPFNHAFLVYRLPKYEIFDNYLDWDKTNTHEVAGDFTKTLAQDYIFFDYGYRVYVSQENTPQKKSHIFLKNLALGSTDPEVAYLQNALISMGFVIPHATTEYYGNETKSALATFQKEHGIADDGSNFGPRTRLALNTTPNPGLIGSIILAFRTYIGI